jgi:hypothetical protein
LHGEFLDHERAGIQTVRNRRSSFFNHPIGVMPQCSRGSMQDPVKRIQDGCFETASFKQCANPITCILVSLTRPVLRLDEELEGSPVRCGAVATGAAMVFGVGALPGAPPPRAGAKSLIFNRSSSLINPLRASCSLPGKARGPGGSLLRGPRYNHAERFRSSERSEGFGLLVLTARPRR